MQCRFFIHPYDQAALSKRPVCSVIEIIQHGNIPQVLIIAVTAPQPAGSQDSTGTPRKDSLARQPSGHQAGKQGFSQKAKQNIADSRVPMRFKCTAQEHKNTDHHSICDAQSYDGFLYQRIPQVCDAVFLLLLSPGDNPDVLSEDRNDQNKHPFLLSFVAFS